MSNVVCRQLGVAAEQITANKNQHLPSHDLHIGQEVMYQVTLSLKDGFQQQSKLWVQNQEATRF